MINEIKENTYRIRGGSYYYVQTENWESEGKKDDNFENFTFPESVIEIKKCECEEEDCPISVSNIDLVKFFDEKCPPGERCLLITDTSNLVRVV